MFRLARVVRCLPLVRTVPALITNTTTTTSYAYATKRKTEANPGWKESDLEEGAGTTQDGGLISDLFKDLRKEEGGAPLTGSCIAAHRKNTIHHLFRAPLDRL